MAVTEIQAKSLLRCRSRVDSWFVSDCGMNLYRGCQHDCSYCDGRAEKYHVAGTFGRDVAVKVNAVDVLQAEIQRRRRKPRGYVMLGGGVGDSYQPVEQRYQVTRGVLALLAEQELPVHVLTKSTLVKRDLDLLRRIHEQRGVIVSMSFSSVDDGMAAVFEPGVPPPGERLRTLRSFKQMDIPCGMFLLPVIPFVTDTEDMVERSVAAASATGLDFVVFGGLTLKNGRQKTHFFEVLQRHQPDLVERYEDIYTGDTWGNAAGEYYDRINQRFDAAACRYRMAKRVPADLYRDILPDDDLAVVMLDQLGYLAKLKHKPAPYGYAAHAISKLKKPLSSFDDLTNIPGVGPTTARLVREMLDSRRCQYYEQLLWE